MGVECCETCRFYEAEKCRRFPPTVIATVDSGWTTAVCPNTLKEGWCGEWKANSASLLEKAVQRPGKIDRRMG